MVGINKELLQSKINQMQEKPRLKLTDIFASYHLQSEDLTIQGFGNIVAKFPLEFYKGNMAKFVEDFQRSIEMALKETHDNNFKVKLLFWR